jgi:hypothetical protein
VCRNCVDKNSNLLDLLKKVDSVRERVTVTKKQRGGDCDQREDVARVQNPVNPVFSTNEFVIISNRDQETQTKPETSEEILESSDACIFGDSIKVYFYTLYFILNVMFAVCVFSHGFYVLQNCIYIVYSVCFNNKYLFNKKA